MSKLEARHVPRKSNIDTKKIAKIFDDAAETARRETRQKKTFSPSSLLYGSSQCARRWYYHFDGSPSIDNTESRSFAIMQAGTDAHTAIQNLMEKAGILEEAEREITASDPPIRGFLDALVNIDGERYVVEIKTTSQESFVFKQASMNPTDYHRLQILIYMGILNVDKGFFIYQNRNTLEMLYIPIEMTEDNKQFLEESLEWMRNTRQAYDDGKIPNRPFREGSKTVCPQCPFYEYCWQEDDREGDIKLPRMKGIK